MIVGGKKKRESREKEKRTRKKRHDIYINLKGRKRILVEKHPFFNHTFSKWLGSSKSLSTIVIQECPTPSDDDSDKSPTLR